MFFCSINPRSNLPLLGASPDALALHPLGSCDSAASTGKEAGQGSGNIAHGSAPLDQHLASLQRHMAGVAASQGGLMGPSLQGTAAANGGSSSAGAASTASASSTSGTGAQGSEGRESSPGPSSALGIHSGGPGGRADPPELHAQKQGLMAALLQLLGSYVPTCTQGSEGEEAESAGAEGGSDGGDLGSGDGDGGAEEVQSGSSRSSGDGSTGDDAEEEQAEEQEADSAPVAEGSSGGGGASSSRRRGSGTGEGCAGEVNSRRCSGKDVSGSPSTDAAASQQQGGPLPAGEADSVDRGSRQQGSAETQPGVQQGQASTPWASGLLPAAGDSATAALCAGALSVPLLLHGSPLLLCGPQGAGRPGPGHAVQAMHAASTEQGAAGSGSATSAPGHRAGVAEGAAGNAAALQGLGSSGLSAVVIEVVEVKNSVPFGLRTRKTGARGRSVTEFCVCDQGPRDRWVAMVSALPAACAQACQTI